MDAGGDSSSKSIPTMKERMKFTQTLKNISSNKEIAPNSNGCTVKIVEKMTSQLEKDSVPMTREHRKTAIESIKRGDCIVKFTVSENPHVIQSTGKGFAFRMGYGYHTFLHKGMSPMSQDTEEFMQMSSFSNTW